MQNSRRMAVKMGRDAHGHMEMSTSTNVPPEYGHLDQPYHVTGTDKARLSKQYCSAVHTN